MTGEQTLRLEADAAKAMGHTRFDWVREGASWVLHTHNPTRNAFAPIPMYTRDPAAILEALEWLCCDSAEANTPPDYRSPLDEVSINHTPTSTTVWLDGLPVDTKDRRIVGETTGEAICLAIVALAKHGDG